MDSIKINPNKFRFAFHMGVKKEVWIFLYKFTLFNKNILSIYPNIVNLRS